MQKIMKVYSSVVVSDLSNDLIQSVDVMYYLSSSSTSLSGGSWVSDPPDWVEGKYYWQKTVTTFKDDSISESDPVCITGAKGSTGTGIVSITEEYYLSTSKESPTGGSWVTNPPAWENGKYIWTRSKIVYSNPSSTEYTTPYCDSSWEAANDVKEDLESQIEEVKSTVSGVSSKVDAVEKSITNKVWQDDITDAINTYDGSTTQILRDRVTEVEQDIDGLTTKVSDVESTVSKKADDSTVTTLSEKVTKMEQDSESFKVTVQNTYVTNDSLSNSLNDYSTTEQMNSAIEAKADEITLSVSSHYATKGEVEDTKSELSLKDDEISQKVTDNTGKITSLTTDLTGITERVEDAEGNISEQTQRVDSIESEIKDARGNSASLKIELDGIKSSVTDLDSEIQTTIEQTDEIRLMVESLEIGGRNLIRNSTFNYDIIGWVIQSGTVYNVISDEVYGNCLQFSHTALGDTGNNRFYQIDFACGGSHINGEEYTLSFYAKADSAITLKAGNVNDLKTFELTTEWIRHSVTYTSTSTGSLTFYVSAANVNAYITQIQLEYGNIPSDWRPASEDLESEVEENYASFNVSINEINSTVASTNEELSEVKQAADEISTEIRDATGSYTLKETFEQVTSKITDAETNMSTQLQQTADGLSVSISSLQDQLSIINKHFEFTDEGLIISSGNSNIKIKLDNEEGLQFLDGETVVAYMDEQKLVITSSEIFESIQIGNFAFTPMDNGSLSFGKIK